MIEGIGTAWMRPENSNRPEDKENIEQMDMAQLRTMMCAKSNGNPHTCEGCAGFKNCRVGQRVMRLRGEDDRAVFQTALESGNAWNWLMVNKGLGKDAAGELLSKMIRKYPGLAADFGGGRRIMQRPRVARIAAQDAQEGPVSAPVATVEETEAGKPEAPEEAKKQLSEGKREAIQKGADANREKAREIAKVVFAQEDPLAYLMRTDGCSRGTARMRIARWIKVYPDLAGDYILPNMQGRKRKEQTEPAETNEPAKEETEMADSDEISLGDFLNEYQDAEDETEEKPDAPAAPETETAAGPGNDILAELNRKYDALAEERKRLEERIRWIEEQQDALVKVRSMFGERAPMYAEANTATEK